VASPAAAKAAPRASASKAPKLTPVQAAREDMRALIEVTGVATDTMTGDEVVALMQTRASYAPWLETHKGEGSDASMRRGMTMFIKDLFDESKPHVFSYQPAKGDKQVVYEGVKPRLPQPRLLPSAGGAGGGGGGGAGGGGGGGGGGGDMQVVS